MRSGALPIATIAPCPVVILVFVVEDRQIARNWNWIHGMNIIWTILIGFIAGLLARAITPGPHNPSGFILTTVLGIVGAALATWLGQMIGWYDVGDKAGFIGAII